MIDGIYKVSFFANSGDLGDGIVVVKTGTINGADHGFLYIGSIDNRAEEFTARITVKRWDPDAYSVFGPVSEFVLELRGRDVAGNKFEAEGHVPGQPHHMLGIRGRYLSAAA